jgi:hypothetical protein
VIACATVAHADPPVYYRVIDLGEPTGGECGEFDIRIVRALAINSKGQVVGEDICIKGGSPDSARGYSWLPEAEYGLLKDRATALSTPQSHGAARDINVNGIIVGWTGPETTPGSSARAIAWNLASGIAQTLLPAQTIQAWGVNDGFQVVGVAEGDGVDIGFFWPPAPPGNPATEIIELPSSAAETYYAYDVANVQSGLTYPRVAGAEVDVPPGIPPFCFDPRGEAVAWYQSGSTFPTTAFLEQPFLTPNPPMDDEIIGEARGVNDLGEFVGAGIEAVDGDPYDCLLRALYWQDLDDLATNLGAVLGIDFLDQSVANALTHTLPRRAVGANVSAGRAIRWELTGDPNLPQYWTLLDLTSVIPACALGDDVPPIVSIGWVVLEEASDITRVEVNGCESDWVVGFGTRVTQTLPLTVKTRAFVLLSTSCPKDTNCDGIIDVDDWVRVTQDYGPCGDGKLCLGDINIDCVVNQADFDLLRAHWGQVSECATQSASAPPIVDLATELFIASPTPEMAQIGAALIEELDEP